MDILKQKVVDRFLGINNVEKPHRLFPIFDDGYWVYPLQQANNVEIDNSFMLDSRPGVTDVKTGTDIHSLWSNGDLCFYVDGSTLYQVDELYRADAIRTGLSPGRRMAYALWNDRVYYMNGAECGYVKNGANYAFTDPSRTFKLPLPAGSFCDVYLSCLYVAVGKKLYISDPLSDYYDTRKGYKHFVNDITMVIAVDDGLYVSDDKVWFLRGDAPTELVRSEAYPVRAIPNTDVKVSGKYFSEAIEGEVAIWTSEDGICIGAKGGAVKNFTQARYTFDASANGAGFVREINNVRHYINSLY
jgi:hypothetical protein